MCNSRSVDFGKYNNDILKAILFHDIIYDATRKDNEDRSADAYFEYFGEKDIAYHLILATKDHFTINVPDLDIQTDAYIKCRNWLVGLDLSSLGSSWDMFKQNTFAIRAEFIHLSDFDFYNGQKLFFNKVLKQEKIFRHNMFYELFELPARRNLSLALREF